VSETTERTGGAQFVAVSICGNNTIVERRISHGGDIYKSDNKKKER
jgi:hypothetical protein